MGLTQFLLMMIDIKTRCQWHIACITDEGCVMFVYEEFDTLKEDSVLVSISARICNDEDFEIALKYFDLGAII